MKWMILICCLSGLATMSNAKTIEQESNWGLASGKGDIDAVITGDSGDQEPPSSILAKIHQISGPDLRAYGIYRGCVPIRRIKNVRFKDDQTAIANLGRDKSVLLRFRKSCPGIKRDGFEYESRQGKICENFTQFIVLGRNMRCTLKSITPYIPIENIRPNKASR